MTDRARLEQALVAADAAGDADAARQLASALREISAQPAIAQRTPRPWSPLRIPGNADETKSYALNLARGNLRNVGLVGRAIMNAVASPPLMAMDAGVGVRNYIDEKRQPKQLSDLIAPKPFQGYELPSQTWSRAQDELGMVKPENITEKAADVVVQMAVGGRMPAPSIRTTAPANFSQQSVRDVTLAASQKAGYTVPPATAKPSFLNKVLEGAAGKLSTAQAASAKNQQTTQELAKRAVWLTGEVTPAALDDIAAQAFRKGYMPVRNVGTMRADAQYAKDLANVAQRFEGASKSFPEAAKNDVAGIVKNMQKQSFETDSAVDMISLLRDRAKAAYRAGDDGLGGAYRGISKALEDAIERGLSRRGKDGAEVLKNFREARQLIAKTHSVGDALNQSTGTVSATKLAQQLGKGKPLSGDLKTIAQFGQAFPKAAREFNESLPGISPLDFATSGGLSAITKNPWYLGGAFLRPGIRKTILSPAGQRALTQPSTPLQPQTPLALLYGAGGLLGQ